MQTISHGQVPSFSYIVHLQLITENKKLQMDLKYQNEEEKQLKQLLNELQNLCQEHKIQAQGD